MTGNNSPKKSCHDNDRPHSGNNPGSPRNLLSHCPVTACTTTESKDIDPMGRHDHLFPLSMLKCTDLRSTGLVRFRPVDWI